MDKQQTAIRAAIEALQNSTFQIEYLYEKFQPTGTGNAIIARNAAALRLLREAGDGWELISEKHRDGMPWLVIHKPSEFTRVVKYHESGAWILLGTGDVFYELAYFTHARPLPAPPEGK